MAFLNVYVHSKVTFPAICSKLNGSGAERDRSGVAKPTSDVFGEHRPMKRGSFW